MLINPLTIFMHFMQCMHENFMDYLCRCVFFFMNARINMNHTIICAPHIFFISFVCFYYYYMHWKQNIFVRTIALNRVWMRLDVRTEQKHRQPKSVYCMNTSFSKTETFKHTNELNTFQSYSNDLNLKMRMYRPHELLVCKRKPLLPLVEYKTKQKK